MKIVCLEIKRSILFLLLVIGTNTYSQVRIGGSSAYTTSIIATTSEDSSGWKRVPSIGVKLKNTLDRVFIGYAVDPLSAGSLITSSDITVVSALSNASTIGLSLGGSTANLFTSRTGTGTYRPLAFHTGALERARIQIGGSTLFGFVNHLAIDDARGIVALKGLGISANDSSLTGHNTLAIQANDLAIPTKHSILSFSGSGNSLPISFEFGLAVPSVTLDRNKNVGFGGQTTFGTNAAGVLGLAIGTAPTTSIVNGVQVYVEDVAASAELKVRDEAGNVIVLSDGASVGGTNGQVQYNNGGVLGGASGFNWDNVNNIVGLGTTAQATRRLVVQGTGATSGTESFVVKNSAGSDAFSIRDDLRVGIGGFYGTPGTNSQVRVFGFDAGNNGIELGIAGLSPLQRTFNSGIKWFLNGAANTQDATIATDNVSFEIGLDIGDNASSTYPDVYFGSSRLSFGWRGFLGSSVLLSQARYTGGLIITSEGTPANTDSSITLLAGVAPAINFLSGNASASSISTNNSDQQVFSGASGGYFFDAALTGGTGTLDDLTLKTTSGIGATGADMHFLVGNNGATEAMTILNNGNVGIRKTNPEVALSVVGSIETTGILSANTLNNATNSANIIYRSGTTTTVGNGAALFNILDNGNVGIGTTAPDKVLEVNLGTSSALRLTYNDANGSAVNFTDFTVSSVGDLTMTPSGADAIVAGKLATTATTLTLGVAATTFAITSNVMTITGDAGGNTVATITGASSGTLLTLIFADALVTITDTNDGAANTVDLDATFTSADDKTLQLVYDGTLWRRVAGSTN